MKNWLSVSILQSIGALVIISTVATAQVTEEWPRVQNAPELHKFLEGLAADDPETYEQLTALRSTPQRVYAEIARLTNEDRRLAKVRHRLLQETTMYLRATGNNTELLQTLTGSSASTWDYLHKTINDELRDLDDRLRTIEQDLAALAQQYHEAPNAAAREATLVQLNTAIERAFDLRFASQEEHLGRIAKLVTDAQRLKHQQRTIKEQVCRKHLEYLLTDPRLRW
jgi:hypothetical protein